MITNQNKIPFKDMSEKEQHLIKTLPSSQVEWFSNGHIVPQGWRDIEYAHDLRVPYIAYRQKET